jgi:ATP-dependent RNA helicase DDX23/PRP28
LLLLLLLLLLLFAVAEANLLFGRGMLAGIDRREQKKLSAAVEADMLRKLREGAGITETAAMRLEAQERQDRADKYGAGDMRVSWLKGGGHRGEG